MNKDHTGPVLVVRYHETVFAYNDVITPYVIVSHVHCMHCSENNADSVEILLLVLRLSEKETDILITLNMPVKDMSLSPPEVPITSDEPSPSQPTDSAVGTVFSMSEDVSTDPGRLPVNATMMQLLLNTFTIVDWSLFG